jgi:hypothetical protein
LHSEINPLHQPEVLSLIGRRHGWGELFVALKATIIGLLSMVNMKQCIKQKRAYHEAKIAECAAIVAEHRAKLEELDAKLMTLEGATEVDKGNEEIEDNTTFPTIRRRRSMDDHQQGGDAAAKTQPKISLRIIS